MLLWLACAAVLLARRPDLLAAPQFHAEDGVIFFVDAVTTGLRSTFGAHAGYHHLLAHLIAIGALAFPVAFAPAVYAWTTVALEAACCALLAPLLRTVIADEPIRWMVALAVAGVVPADEVIGSVANLQWYLALPMLAAALVPLDVRTARAARVFAVIVGATTPQGLIAAPVAAYLWWKRPPGRDPWIATLYSLTSFLNVVTAPSAPGGHPTSPLLQALVTVPAFRIADMLLLGKSATVFLAAFPLLGVAIGLAALAAALLLLARVRGVAVASTMAYVMLAPVVLVLLTRQFVGTEFSSYNFFSTDRYFVTACAALLIVLGTIVSAAGGPRNGRIILACLLVIGLGLNLREPHTLPDLKWSASVPSVERWLAARDAGGPTPAVAVPIPPVPWNIILRACGAGASGGMLPRCP
jgi:hypothetical protein